MTIYYLASFLAGAAVGIALLLAHQASVRKAVQEQQKQAATEARRLNLRIRDMEHTIAEQREDLNAYECSTAAASARREGKVVGLRQGANMTEAERLQYTLAGPRGTRDVKMGGASQ